MPDKFDPKKISTDKPFEISVDKPFEKPTFETPVTDLHTELNIVLTKDHLKKSLST